MRDVTSACACFVCVAIEIR